MEDAAKLQLGADFADAKGLLLMEVRMVLDEKLASDKMKGEESSTTKTRHAGLTCCCSKKCMRTP